MRSSVTDRKGLAQQAYAPAVRNNRIVDVDIRVLVNKLSTVIHFVVDDHVEIILRGVLGNV